MKPSHYNLFYRLFSTYKTYKKLIWLQNLIASQGVSIGIPELDRTTVFLFLILSLFPNTVLPFPLAYNSGVLLLSLGSGTGNARPSQMPRLLWQVAAIIIGHSTASESF